MENSDQRTIVSRAAKGWFYFAAVLATAFYAACCVFSTYGLFFEPDVEFPMHSSIVLAGLNGLYAALLTFKMRTRGPYWSIVATAFICVATFFPGMRSDEVPEIILLGCAPMVLLLSLLGVMKTMRRAAEEQALRADGVLPPKRKVWKYVLALGVAALCAGAGIVYFTQNTELPKRTDTPFVFPDAPVPALGLGDHYYRGAKELESPAMVAVGCILSPNRSVMREVVVTYIDSFTTSVSGNERTSTMKGMQSVRVDDPRNAVDEAYDIPLPSGGRLRLRDFKFDNAECKLQCTFVKSDQTTINIDVDLTLREMGRW